MVRRTTYEAQAQAAGDDAPDVKGILKSMNWDERLAEARERRARVLAAKAGEAAPKPDSTVPPEPQTAPAEPPDETNLPRLTLVPAPVGAPDPKLRPEPGPPPPAPARNATVAPAVLPHVAEEIAPRRRSALSMIFAAGVGLGIGVALGFGILALFVPAERIVPTLAAPQPPATSAPAPTPTPDPVVGAAAPAATVDPVTEQPPTGLTVAAPVSPSGPEALSAALSTPRTNTGPNRADAPTTVAALGPGDSLPAVRPGLGLGTEGPAQPLLLATLTSPTGAGFRLPEPEIPAVVPPGVVALPPPAARGRPGSGPSLAQDGRAVLRIAALASPPAEAAPGPDLSAPSDAPLATPRVARLTAPVPVAALPLTPGAPEPASRFAVAPPADFSDLSIFVFVPPSRPGNTTEATVAALRDTGLPVGTPRNSGFTIRQSHVRYYHSRDAEFATILADAVGGPARDFTDFRPAPPAGTLEIWLSGQAAPRGTGTRSGGNPLVILRDRLVQSLRRGDHLDQ
jgi:hypothetical protein